MMMLHVACSILCAEHAKRTTTTTTTTTTNNNNATTNTGDNNIGAQTFTFRELASATKNFRQEFLLGEGGFGRVYKGHLDQTNQVRVSFFFFFSKSNSKQILKEKHAHTFFLQMVAVKQLDRNGLQGNREFLVEVLMLSLLHHQNLVNLIGYCADGEQRLLVYEYMPLGSLEDHLLGIQIRRFNLISFQFLKIYMLFICV